ncbi:MAG: hypothetical protein HY739_09385 [Desulfobacterales bacterium]|nr:hypothetical protein [Desulfobacterales bacterium]
MIRHQFYFLDPSDKSINSTEYLEEERETCHEEMEQGLLEEAARAEAWVEEVGAQAGWVVIGQAPVRVESVFVRVAEMLSPIRQDLHVTR